MDEKRSAFSVKAPGSPGFGVARKKDGFEEDEVDADEILPEYNFRLARPNPYASRAERLTATLAGGPPDPEVEQAWFQEAERRRQQLLDGSVQGILAEEVFARLSAKWVE